MAFEVVLGVWLLSGRYAVGAWLTALFTFATFAGVSAYSGWIGKPSCGCLGRVELNPWWAFAIDIVAVIGLLIARPKISENLRGAWCRARRPALGFVGLSVLLFAVLLAVGYLMYGSADAVLASLRGDTITLSPRTADVGSGPAGEIKETTIEVRNLTDRDVRIVGGTSDCSCVVTKELPVVVPAGESRTIGVSLRLPAEAGRVSRPARLIIDNGQLTTVSFRLAGRAE